MKSLFLVLAIFCAFPGIGGSVDAAEGNWHDDFAIICAQTVNAGKLGREELDRLIADSGELLEIIESSDDPGKRVYLLRLKKCRNFFLFMKQISNEPEDN